MAFLFRAFIFRVFVFLFSLLWKLLILFTLEHDQDVVAAGGRGKLGRSILARRRVTKLAVFVSQLIDAQDNLPLVVPLGRHEIDGFGPLGGINFTVSLSDF